MEQNPYEAPRADQKQKPLPDWENNTDSPAGSVMVLGCLMFPASFIAFFCVCQATGEGQIGVQPTEGDWGLAPSFAAAGFVAFVFICAMVSAWSRRGGQ
jgi:hypothetical protein